MFRTSNPALRDDVFQVYGAGSSMAEAQARSGAMTVGGVVNRTAILLCLCAGAAVFAWSLILPGSAAGEIVAPKVNPMLPLFGGLIGGLVLALITSFKPKASPITAPLYALFEGLFVGSISAFYAANWGTTQDGVLSPNYGMIMQAVMLTFGVLGVMLLAYRARIIKVTDRFRTMVVSATGAICLVYLASWILGVFGVSVPFIHSSGPLGIGFSVFVVALAAMNLALDFEFVAQGAQQGAPKYMEWYAGFGLLVTLVWLYLEILRLLSKIQSRD